jgi:hypothetical protein
MAKRRGGPPPDVRLDPSALTSALRCVGAGYARYKQENGSKAEPVVLRADRAKWMAIDTLSTAIYGMAFARLIGRSWWPRSDPPRAPERVIDESLGALVVAVG